MRQNHGFYGKTQRCQRWPPFIYVFQTTVYQPSLQQLYVTVSGDAVRLLARGAGQTFVALPSASVSPWRGRCVLLWAAGVLAGLGGSLAELYAAFTSHWPGLCPTLPQASTSTPTHQECAPACRYVSEAVECRTT